MQASKLSPGGSDMKKSLDSLDICLSCKSSPGSALFGYPDPFAATVILREAGNCGRVTTSYLGMVLTDYSPLPRNVFAVTDYRRRKANTSALLDLVHSLIY